MFCDLEDECGLCIKMDDDSCVLKYIEIVPFENNAEQFEDLKPFQVKVCIFLLYSSCGVGLHLVK